MPTVHYPTEVPYTYDADGNLLPRLTLACFHPERPQRVLDVDAVLDSGAARSLFDGWIGSSLGLDILAGQKIGYQSAMDTVLTATIHVVRFEHAELGIFDMEVGFSSVPLKRNLLGRDFFSLFQVGFRERHMAFYLSAET